MADPKAKLFSGHQRKGWYKAFFYKGDGKVGIW